MPEKYEIIWHARGKVVETFSQEGRKKRVFWKLILKIDEGFVCAYIREPSLIKIAESLQVDQIVQVAGVVTSQKEVAMAERPVFLNATQIVVQSGNS